MQIIDHFDALTDQGLKIIPLRENSKIPLCKKWNQDWDRNHNREKLRIFPDSNIGILLGDVIDVEGDSDHANNTILSLIGDYPHPTYTSRKSIHHLFKTPDTDLRLMRVGQIEFRGHGHQSVMPPSHSRGVNYTWLRQMKFPVPEMPDSLYAFYLKNKHKKDIIKRGHIQIWCSECEEKCFLHKKRFKLELEAFGILGHLWKCRGCRNVDLRPVCRLIRAGVKDGLTLNNFPQF